jgi:hypothetical protein
VINLPIISSFADFPQTVPDKTVNLYGNKIGETYFLECSPGLKLFGEALGNGAIRNMLTFKAQDQFLFLVRGNIFQMWDTGLSAFVSLGIVSSVVGKIGMSYNSYQVLIVDDANAYVYDVYGASAGTFAIIDGIGPPSHGAFPFQGGNSTAVFAGLRMYSIEPNSGRVFASNRDNDPDGARTWDPIAEIEAETFPDPLVGMANIGPAMLVFGSDSFEVWVDQGLPIFPYRRVQAGASIGCSAPNSIAVFGGFAYWLGGSREGRGIVYRAKGTEAEEVSTHEIDAIIQTLPNFSDAVGYVFQEDGHPFYVLNFLEGDKTLVFDISHNLWSEWEYRNADGTTSRHPAIAQAVYTGLNLVGDSRNGNVYEMSRKYVTNDGLPIVREKIFTIWPPDPYEFTNMPPFFLALDVGQVASGLEEPLAMLSWSDDRGKLYSQMRVLGLGFQGEYNKRLVWHGMGSSYGRAYRIRLTGPVSFVIRGAGML